MSFLFIRTINLCTVLCQWRRSGAFIVNFQQYFKPCSSNSIVNFEQVIADWVVRDVYLKVTHT